MLGVNEPQGTCWLRCQPIPFSDPPSYYAESVEIIFHKTKEILGRRYGTTSAYVII